MSFYLLCAFSSQIQKKAISPERGHFPSSLERWTVFLYLDEARSDLDASATHKHAHRKRGFRLGLPNAGILIVKQQRADHENGNSYKKKDHTWPIFVS